MKQSMATMNVLLNTGPSVIGQAMELVKCLCYNWCECLTFDYTVVVHYLEVFHDMVSSF